MARWKRFGMWSLLLLGSAWLLDLSVMHGMVWYFAKDIARQPSAWVVPETLTDTSVLKMDGGVRVEVLGHSLWLPWKEIAKREDTRSILVSLHGGEGQSVIISKIAAVLLKGKTDGEAALLRRMYRSEALKSNYDALKAEFNAVPKDVSIWNSRERNAGLAVELGSKEGQVSKAKHIYPISTGIVRGFQIGDPKSEPMVRLILFDEMDQEFWIMLRGSPAHSLTQSEINTVAASFCLTS